MAVDGCEMPAPSSFNRMWGDSNIVLAMDDTVQPIAKVATRRQEGRPDKLLLQPMQICGA